jgi:cell division protein FtsW
VLQRDGADRRTGSAALAAGQQLRIGAARFSVAGADSRAVAFSGAGQQWRYDGATLLRDGAAQPSCPDARPAARLAAAWNRIVAPAMALAKPLTFGGNLYCDNRLGLEHVDSGSAVLARVKGRLVLSGAAGGGEHAPLLLSSGAGQFDLAQKEEALDGVSALVAGRTRFGLRIDAGRLEFRPASHAALFAEARNQQLPPQVQWQWRLRPSWALPGGPAWWVALALCGALVLAGALAWQRGHWPFVRDAGAGARRASVGTALLAIAGVAALILQRSGTPPGIGLSILLGCGALWCCLLLPGRLTLAPVAGILLLAVGLLAQLELGLGAMESSSLRH